MIKELALNNAVNDFSSSQVTRRWFLNLEKRSISDGLQRLTSMPVYSPVPLNLIWPCDFHVDNRMQPQWHWVPRPGQRNLALSTILVGRHALREATAWKKVYHPEIAMLWGVPRSWREAGEREAPSQPPALQSSQPTHHMWPEKPWTSSQVPSSDSSPSQHLMASCARDRKGESHSRTQPSHWTLWEKNILLFQATEFWDGWLHSNK